MCESQVRYRHIIYKYIFNIRSKIYLYLYLYISIYIHSDILMYWRVSESNWIYLESSGVPVHQLRSGQPSAHERRGVAADGAADVAGPVRAAERALLQRPPGRRLRGGGVHRPAAARRHLPPPVHTQQDRLHRLLLQGLWRRWRWKIRTQLALLDRYDISLKHHSIESFQRIIPKNHFKESSQRIISKDHFIESLPNVQLESESNLTNAIENFAMRESSLFPPHFLLLSTSFPPQPPQRLRW